MNYISNNTELLDTKEAAAFLRTTEAAVRNLVYRRKLPGFKPFGRLLFKKIDLERIVENSRKGDRI